MNLKRILSKTSVRSSASSGKYSGHTEEFSKLQSDYEILKKNFVSLQIAIEDKDAAIGTLAREKEKLFVELKSMERANNYMQQQLIDEREMHSKEKEYFILEIKRLSPGNPCINTNIYNFHSEIKAKDETIYNICSKYFKIKSSKIDLQIQMEKLKEENCMICEDIIKLLDKNRKSFDRLLDNLTRVPTELHKRQYLDTVKINGRLQFENTELKILLASSQFIQRHHEYEDNTPQKYKFSNLNKIQHPTSAQCRIATKLDYYQFDENLMQIQSKVNYNNGPQNLLHRWHSDPSIHFGHLASSI